MTSEYKNLEAHSIPPRSTPSVCKFSYSFLSLFPFLFQFFKLYSSKAYVFLDFNCLQKNFYNYSGPESLSVLNITLYLIQSALVGSLLLSSPARAACLHGRKGEVAWTGSGFPSFSTLVTSSVELSSSSLTSSRISRETSVAEDAVDMNSFPYVQCGRLLPLT